MMVRYDALFGWPYSMRITVFLLCFVTAITTGYPQSRENGVLELSISASQTSVCGSQEFVVEVEAKNVGDAEFLIDSWRIGKSFEVSWSIQTRNGGSGGNASLDRTTKVDGIEPRFVKLDPDKSIIVKRSFRFGEYDLRTGQEYSLRSNFTQYSNKGTNLWTGSVYSNSLKFRLKKCRGDSRKRQLPTTVSGRSSIGQG